MVPLEEHDKSARALHVDRWRSGLRNGWLRLFLASSAVLSTSCCLHCAKLRSTSEDTTVLHRGTSIVSAEWGGNAQMIAGGFPGSALKIFSDHWQSFRVMDSGIERSAVRSDQAPGPLLAQLLSIGRDERVLLDILSSPVTLHGLVRSFMKMPFSLFDMWGKYDGDVESLLSSMRHPPRLYHLYPQPYGEGGECPRFLLPPSGDFVLPLFMGTSSAETEHEFLLSSEVNSRLSDMKSHITSNPLRRQSHAIRGRRRERSEVDTLREVVVPSLLEDLKGLDEACLHYYVLGQFDGLAYGWTDVRFDSRSPGNKEHESTFVHELQRSCFVLPQDEAFLLGVSGSGQGLAVRVGSPEAMAIFKKWVILGDALAPSYFGRRSWMYVLGTPYLAILMITWCVTVSVSRPPVVLSQGPRLFISMSLLAWRYVIVYRLLGWIESEVLCSPSDFSDHIVMFQVQLLTLEFESSVIAHEMSADMTFESSPDEEPFVTMRRRVLFSNWIAIRLLQCIILMVSAYTAIFFHTPGEIFSAIGVTVVFVYTPLVLFTVKASPEALGFSRIDTIGNLSKLE